MAAPESQRQAAGISATGYTPVRTELAPPIRLEGSGELWAGVGATALSAADRLNDTILKSPINPMVKAQWQEATARAQSGIAYNKYLQSLTPEQRFLLERWTPQGLETISPAEAGAKVFPYFQPKIKPPNEPPAPPAPSHAPGTGNQPLIQSKTPAPAPSDQNDPDKPPPSLASATYPYDTYPYNGTMYAQQGGLVPGTPAAPGFQGIRYFDNGGKVDQPPSMYLDPATGSYKPLNIQSTTPEQAKRQVEAQQVAQVEGAARAQIAHAQAQQTAQAQQQTTPPVWQPPGVQQQPPQAQQPPIPMRPAEQTPAPMTPSPQDMANWQAQNAHPPADAGSALEWAKRFHTGYKTATYLPQGGPDGPAYNFSDGKSSNIVPVSQMVKNGFGPSVVAQNTSSVLGMVDRANQAAQGAQGPGLPFGPVLPPQPAAQQPQPPGQAQPPGAQPQQGGQVWNPLQPAPLAGPRPPPAPGGPPPPYDPAAAAATVAGRYQQTLAGINAGNVANPALMAQTGQQADARTDVAAKPAQPPQPDPSKRLALSDDEKSVLTPEAIANARANAKETGAKNENGDPEVGQVGPYHMYRDDTYGSGEYYFARPGLSSLFKQQRLMLGADGWDEYELPTTAQRMAMDAEFGSGRGVTGASELGIVKGATADDKFPNFDTTRIANMSPENMKGWLELAGKYHHTQATPNDVTSQRLAILGDASQRLGRIADGMDAADKAGMDPRLYSTGAQYLSHQALKRDEQVPAGGFEQVDLTKPLDWGKELGLNVAQGPNQTLWDYHNLRAQYTNKNHFSNYLEQQSQGLNSDMVQLQATGRVPLISEKVEGPSASVYWGGAGATVKGGYDPYKSVPSPHQEVQNMFGGDEDPKESRKNILSVKNEYDKMYMHEYEQAIGSGWRPTADAAAAYARLKKGADIADDQNKFRDSNGNTTNPFTTGHESTAVFPSRGSAAAAKPTSSSSPSLEKIETTADVEAFRKKWPDPKTRPHVIWHGQEGTIE